MITAIRQQSAELRNIKTNYNCNYLGYLPQQHWRNNSNN